jgi:uncharacterized protein (DUF2141 family)
MKIILAVTTLFVMAPAPVVLAQQTGRAPIAPPPRTASVVPVAPAAGVAASTTTADTTTAAAPPPVAAPSRPIVPPTQNRPPRSGNQGTVLVEIETAQTNGRIAVALYRDADSFRKSENPVRTMMLTRTGNVTSAFVANLPPGRYVIAAFQDTDGDGKLSKGSFGIPREPFGFSNGARARFGLPAFDAAAFELTPAGATQRVVLRGVF